VRLPVPVPLRSQPRPLLGEQVPPRAGRGERILLVDDNDDALATLAAALGNAGFEVATASDGPAALRVAARFGPRLGIFDLGLPVMDGYELAQRVRALGPVGQIPLIAVTGYGLDTDRARSRAAGYDEHLIKPVDLRLLIDRMSRLLVERPHRAGAAGSSSTTAHE